MESKILQVEEKTLKGKLPIGLAVIGDNVSNRITFSMLKTIDGVDITQKSIYVCYKNANGESYLRNCVNKVISGDKITFDWYITREATAFAGTVNFHLEISDGDYLWRSYDSQFTVDDCVIGDVAQEIEYEPNWLDAINEAISNGQANIAVSVAAAATSATNAASSASAASTSASNAATSASNAQSYYTQAQTYVNSHTEIIVLTANLTNTAAYPFNSSTATVAFPTGKTRNTTDYIINAEVTASVGDVGNIVISDKMVNGFKVAYTGSATSATIKLYVQGGL